MPSHDESTRDWDSSCWNEALAGHFFGPDSEQLPVLFFVDDGVLAELHSSGEPAAAIVSLAGAVQARLSSLEPRALFKKIYRSATEWQAAGSEGTPPFLDFLALSVLAATRMGQGSRAHNGYYAPLADLLARDRRDVETSFRQYGDLLWAQLGRWLDDTEGGLRGRSTLPQVNNGSARYYVDFPLSQTLFKRSDRARLDDFFRWIELRPDEELDGGMLCALFEAWAPLNELTPGARLLVEDSEFRATLRSILAGYAKSWTGTSSRASSGSQTHLVPVVEFFPRKQIFLVGERKPDMPEQLRLSTGRGTLALSAEDGWYRGSLPDELTLRRGCEAKGDRWLAALRGDEVFVLAPNPDMGGLAPVSTVRPNERYWILASPARASEVEDRLKDSAGEEWGRQRAPRPIREWSLFEGVTFRSGVSLTGALARYTPSHGHRFVLSGGLPLLPNNAYLSGGAPDVFLPTTEHEGHHPPRLNGRNLTKGCVSQRLEGSPALRTPGHNVVAWRSAERSFSVTESTVLVTPEGRLFHGVWGTTEGPLRFRGPGPLPIGLEPPPVRVSGALVSGATPRERRRIVLVPSTASAAWIVGARPGEVAAVEMTAPPWLAWARLSAPYVEVEPAFDPAWIASSNEANEIILTPVSALAVGEVAEDTRHLDDWCYLMSIGTLSDDVAAPWGEATLEEYHEWAAFLETEHQSA